MPVKRYCYGPLYGCDFTRSRALGPRIARPMTLTIMTSLVSFSSHWKMIPEKFLSDDCSKNLKGSDQQTTGIRWPVNFVSNCTLVFIKLDVRRHKNTKNFETAQLKTQLNSEALRPFLGRYLEKPTVNNNNAKIPSWCGLKLETLKIWESIGWNMPPYRGISVKLSSHKLNWKVNNVSGNYFSAQISRPFAFGVMWPHFSYNIFILCRGGSRGRVQGVRIPPPWDEASSFVLAFKICLPDRSVTSFPRGAPSPNKNPRSAPVMGYNLKNASNGKSLSRIYPNGQVWGHWH